MYSLTDSLYYFSIALVILLFTHTPVSFSTPHAMSVLAGGGLAMCK
jgi:hypothetical protein